jgi:hypothetical protein
LGAQAVGDMGHIIGVGQNIFGEAAVSSVTPELGSRTNSFPGG